MASRFQRALVIGASSGIGAEIARQLAADGTQVALVARRADTLSELATTLPTGKARLYPHDVTCYDEVPALFQTICRDLGGLDLVIYAAGVMPRIALDEYTFEKDQQMIAVNVLGAIAWLNEAAQRFAAQKAGTIVGISSVAGDRGRAPQPVYNTSKAALDCYLEALRNRVGSLGVRVVTAKPGTVQTPMTAGLDKLPMPVTAAVAARGILAAAHKGTRIAYIPGKWKLIMGIIKAIPSPLFQRLKL